MPAARGRGARLVDWLAAADPGFNRLNAAVRAVVGLLVVIGVELLLLDGTGALQARAGPGVTRAAAAAQHHQILVIAFLLNGVIAMTSALAVNAPTPGAEVASLLTIPLFAIPAITFGMAIGGHRSWTLLSFPIVLAVGGYCRRFGQRAAMAAMLLFMGEFIGFLLHPALPLRDVGWLAAEIGVATAALVILRATIFRANPERRVRLLRRSFHARIRRVAVRTLAYLDEPSPATGERLAGELRRLNESALLIDAQLPRGAGHLHQRLFDVELAVTNLARFAQAMADAGLSPRQRQVVSTVLAAVRDGDLDAARAATAEARRLDDGTARGFDRIVRLRFATSLDFYLDASTEWISLTPSPSDEGNFSSVVGLRGGWLPGAATVSATAATTRRGLHLPLYMRTAIQTAAAVGLAVVIGDAISPRRFYWAVLAAALAFVGTNYVSEQARKAIYRVAGTIAGIVIGSALVRVIGHDTVLALTVVLVAVFFGVYLFRVSYAFMVIAVTVAISLVYVELDEFSTSLLLTRLAETVVGSAAALAVVAFVFPLRRSQVLEVAITEQLTAIKNLVTDAVEGLVDAGAPVELRADAREVDAAHQALLSTLAPLQWAVLGDVNRRLAATAASATAARNYSRTLIADVAAARPFEPPASDSLFLAVTTLGNSIDALIAALGGDRARPYVRAAALLEQVRSDLGAATDQTDGRWLALRDLTRLDGALATMAAGLGVEVVGLDTGPEAPEGTGRASSGAPAGETAAG